MSEKVKRDEKFTESMSETMCAVRVAASNQTLKIVFWLLLLSNPFAIFTRNNNMFHVKIMAQGFQLLHLLHCESAVGKVLTL